MWAFFYQKIKFSLCFSKIFQVPFEINTHRRIPCCKGWFTIVLFWVHGWMILWLEWYVVCKDEMGGINDNGKISNNWESRDESISVFHYWSSSEFHIWSSQCLLKKPSSHKKLTLKFIFKKKNPNWVGCLIIVNIIFLRLAYRIIWPLVLK